jgi:hypothetical protein
MSSDGFSDTATVETVEIGCRLKCLCGIVKQSIYRDCYRERDIDLGLTLTVTGHNEKEALRGIQGAYVLQVHMLIESPLQECWSTPVSWGDAKQRIGSMKTRHSR